MRPFILGFGAEHDEWKKLEQLTKAKELVEEYEKATGRPLDIPEQVPSQPRKGRRRGGLYLA